MTSRSKRQRQWHSLLSKSSERKGHVSRSRSQPLRAGERGVDVPDERTDMMENYTGDYAISPGRITSARASESHWRSTTRRGGDKKKGFSTRISSKHDGMSVTTGASGAYVLTTIGQRIRVLPSSRKKRAPQAAHNDDINGGIS